MRLKGLREDEQGHSKMVYVLGSQAIHQQDDASLEVLGIPILADPSSLPAHLVPEDLPGFSATYQHYSSHYWHIGPE